MQQINEESFTRLQVIDRRRQITMQNLHDPSQVDKIQNRADLFAERFSKQSFRTY